MASVNIEHLPTADGVEDSQTKYNNSNDGVYTHWNWVWVRNRKTWINERTSYLCFTISQLQLHFELNSAHCVLQATKCGVDAQQLKVEVLLKMATAQI